MGEMIRVTNLTKRQKEIALVVLSVLLFISLAAYSYFKVYVPVKDTNEQMKLTTSNERDVLFALRKQSAAQGQTDTTSSQPLQRKVPSMPLEDAVLLQIGKAEIKSGTLVQDIAFAQGEFIIENPVENVENINQLLTEVVLQSDSYTGIEKFVDEIEKMERVFIIDSISINVPVEIRDQQLDEGMIEMTVAFSAFYRPDLVGLQHEVPKIDAPPPSEKIDPTPFNDSVEAGDTK